MATDDSGILRAPVYLQISRRHRYNGWFNSHLMLQSLHTLDDNKRHCAFTLKSTEIIFFWRWWKRNEETGGNNIKENGHQTPPLSFYNLLREMQWWKTKKGHSRWGHFNLCSCHQVNKVWRLFFFFPWMYWSKCQQYLIYYCYCWVLIFYKLHHYPITAILLWIMR